MKFAASLGKNMGVKIRQILQSLPGTIEYTGIEGEATCGQSYFEYNGPRISDCKK